MFLQFKKKKTFFTHTYDKINRETFRISKLFILSFSPFPSHSKTNFNLTSSFFRIPLKCGNASTKSYQFIQSNFIYELNWNATAIATMFASVEFNFIIIFNYFIHFISSIFVQNHFFIMKIYSA